MHRFRFARSVALRLAVARTAVSSTGRLLTALAVATAAVAALTPAGAAAQTVVLPQLPDAYVPVKPADDALYQELGGEAGIAAIVAEFSKRNLADRRVEPFFRDADPAELTRQLAIHLCEVTGGPCERGKRNIRRAHSGMDIDAASFNAVVENLQQAMDACGIAFGAQNRLLAQLAPMHRDIVNVH